MKTLLIILSLILWCTGCYTSYSYLGYNDTVTKKSQFTNLPIKPTEEEIQLFFPGEKLPEEQYIKVDILDAAGGESVPTVALVEVLKLKAKERGIDGLIILGTTSFSDTYGDYDDEIYTVTTQKMTAVGIKFIKNIDYLDECFRQASVITFNEKTERDEVVLVIETDWKGNLLGVKKGEHSFWKFLYNFSKQHLIEERKGWAFNAQVNDEVTQLNRVLNHPYDNGAYAKTVSARIFENRVISIRVKDLYNLGYSAKINFNYKNGQLISKEIKTYTKTNFIQEFIYREDGLLLQSEVYKLEEAERIFLFKVIYETYKQKDLELLLAKENVLGG